MDNNFLMFACGFLLVFGFALLVFTRVMFWHWESKGIIDKVDDALFFKIALLTYLIMVLYVAIMWRTLKV